MTSGGQGTKSGKYSGYKGKASNPSCSDREAGEQRAQGQTDNGRGRAVSALLVAAVLQNGEARRSVWISISRAFLTWSEVDPCLW